jgi:hypothetical protein
MRKPPRLIGLGMAAAASTLAFAALNSVNLQISPKVGDRFKYKMTGRLEVMGSSADISADIDCKVTVVDRDRNYTMTSSQTNMQAVVAGQIIHPPDSSSITVSKENGELLDFRSDSTDATSWRMVVLKRFIYPPKRVNIGDQWTSSVLADSKRGTVAASSTFKLESLEKIGKRDTAKVRVSFQEKEGAEPASSDGHVWIDISDGSMVRTQANWRNAPSAQGPINGKVTIERV